MRAFKTISWIGFVGASAIIAVACDSAVEYEKPSPDAGIDSSVADTGADVVDAGPNTFDGGRDVGPDVADSGPDVRDSGPDVVDSGPPDAGPPPNYSVEIAKFMKDQTLASCSRYKAGCGNPANWRQAKCEGILVEGYAALYEDLARTPASVTAGRLNYDAAKAAACIAAIGTMEFPVRSAANQKSITDACSTVVTGRQALGAACNAPIECVSGATCKTGTCVPVGALNAACDLWPVGSSAVRSNSCSTHGIGDTNRVCGSLNGSPATCIALVPAGGPCINDHVCASDMCGVDTRPGATAGICADSYDEVATQDPCTTLTTP